MKKIIVSFILIPIIIFAVGAILVLVGGGLNSIFEKDFGSPAAEDKTPSQTKKTEVPPAKVQKITQITKPAISYATVYYDVNGLTKDEIRTSMKQAQTGTFLEGHDGATTAQININFKRRQLADKCETVMDKFDVSLTYTYPRLISLPNVSPKIAAEWNRFIDALKIHEEGHAKIEIERAGLMLRELQKIPTYATCEEFDRVWQAKADTFDLETKQIEAAYDRDTQNGKTQGATF